MQNQYRCLNIFGRYLPFITLRRTVNFIKLGISFWLSRFVRKPMHYGMPFALSVEPGTACDLHCPQCPTGNGTLLRKQGRMTARVFRKILEDLPEVTVLNLYLQGEPFLHNEIIEMIETAAGKNIYVITSTNGQHITEETAEKIICSGLSEIRISMDGVTQESYEKYRKGGNLEKVKDTIRFLSEAKRRTGKRTPCVIAQFIVFKHNQDEVEEFEKMAEELGADKTEIKTAQFYEIDGQNVLPPDKKKFRRYVSSHELKMKGRMYNHCWKSWMSAVVTWDGNVLPCCYDKDGEYMFGNVDVSDFREIWKGKTADEFRWSILTKKSELDICRNCPEGRSFMM
ncbi:MAG: radical SAM protein [Chlorobi bacterium]|nr:radical SAM protein [Chlorobiota bacterium]